MQFSDENPQCFGAVFSDRRGFVSVAPANSLPSDVVPASLSRILLALSLDLVIFQIFVCYWHLFLSHSPGVFLQIILFATYIVFFQIFLGGSFGRNLLRIRKGSQILNQPRNVVDADLYYRGSYFGMLVAVLMFCLGAFYLVRWHFLLISYPVFGVLLGKDAFLIASVLSGAFCIWVSRYLFMADIRGLVPAGAFIAIQVASIILGWEIWKAYVPQFYILFQEQRGVVANASLLQDISAIGPIALLLGFILSGLILVLTRKRWG